jgi:hypothetical protein
MVYLHEHYGGVSTISSLIAHPANGISGVSAVLSARGYSQDFEDVFSDWKIANYLDDTAFASGKYGYRNLDLRIRPGSTHFSFPVSNVSRYIQSWAADYIEFAAPSTGGQGKVPDLQIDLIGRNPAYSFDVRAIAMNSGAPVAVEDVNGYISIPQFGYAVDTVVLVPNWQPRAEADFGEIVSYSCSARLGQEISFDVAVLPNAVHERYVDIVVQFDVEHAASPAYPGDTGDSVPRITVTRLGETLIGDRSMAPILPVGSREKVAYVYQLYVPHGWDGSEIKWDISYLGRSLSGGDLGYEYFGF